MTGIGPTSTQRRIIDACFGNDVPFLWDGSGTLLAASDGVETLLQTLAGQGEVLLGLEGFEVEGAAIRPRLDLVLDASRGLDIRTTFSTWPKNIWVDVTISADPS